MIKNIGILFPSSNNQGVFQYSLSIADSLINYSNNFNYSIFYYSDNPKALLKIRKDVQFIRLNSSSRSMIGKLKLLFNIFCGQNIFLIDKINQKILKDIKIDLLIIPFPLLFGLENKIPYLIYIPDIMHKYYPHFPEYNLRTRLKRDVVYKFSARHSLFNVVDSEQGLNDLHRFYKIAKERIRPISYIPPGYIYNYKNMSLRTAESLLKKYNLPRKFIFYPAQFWYHKNHQRLIKALNLLKNDYKKKIPLLLVGSAGANPANYEKVEELIKEFDMENQIFHLGYVSDKEIIALYKKATALVFPTLIGPTSIPPLEAMVLGTPVLCSNLFSMPEQVGSAGLLFNPFDVNDMADKIFTIWMDKRLRKDLVQKGKKITKDLNLKNHAQQWERIINDTENLWKKI